MRYPSFNTQPPEGGWAPTRPPRQMSSCFNTQPPEGGWDGVVSLGNDEALFQHTAARRRLAA